MVLGRIFPKITKFYLDGSPAEAEIAYPDKVRRVHIRLGGQKEQITAGPEGVIYITKGYPSALQIKWALKLQKKKFLPYFKFFEAGTIFRSAVVKPICPVWNRKRKCACLSAPYSAAVP